MPWDSSTSLPTLLLSPHPAVIALTLLIALALPTLLHFLLYRGAARPARHDFLVLGVEQAGKTTLLCTLGKGARAETRTSQTALRILTRLPASHRAASEKFRSANDAAAQAAEIHLQDAPGHGKLRHLSFAALEALHGRSGKGRRGAGSVIFVVDSTALAPGSAGLTDAAGFLYELLLRMQRLAEGGAAPVRNPGWDVLVAAGKQDLFTALPVDAVRAVLEGELQRLREARGRGVARVRMVAGGLGGADEDGAEEEEGEDGILGGAGEAAFTFEELREVGVRVQVLGGNCFGEGDGVDNWWAWIAERM